MVKEDLMEHAKSTVDFYELLGVAFETSEADIRRAYRKTALRYHPDKLGKDFDPDKFHLLQIANDVLSDASAKALYDNTRNARLHKQRQHELFEGKRRQMKEDLEARERGGASTSYGGTKRPREEDDMEEEIRRLAEEGRRKREEMEGRMKAQGAFTAEGSTASPSQPEELPAEPVTQPQTAAEEAEEEDEVARLERRIQEAQDAKAKRKAEKKARKSGAFVPGDFVTGSSPERGARKEAATPIKGPDLKELKADQKSSASPKFSFSPRGPASSNRDFAATMARLKAAEKRRLEDKIIRQEAGTSP